MSNIILSNEEKCCYQSAIRDIHDIFKREFIVFRQAERVVISQNPNFIFPYGDNQPDSGTDSYVINSATIYARIWHVNGMQANKESLATSSSDREFSGRGEAQLRFRNDKDYVRLKLDEDGYNFINGAKTVEVDGGNYNFYTAYRKHGLFTPEFWTVWLEENS